MSVRGGMHFYRGSGAGAARYFDEGHQGAESYYTEAAQVAVEIDTWTAGERSGTTVLAAPGDLVRWVEGIDPATGEVKGTIRSCGEDRQPLRFVEVVVNNPKSLSIVASQNPAVAAALERTLARQADEIARYLSAVAVTRIGPRGAQREVGELAVETARVTHLTSREGDPHRHVHLMLNTRVKTPDGTWHGLHSAAIRQHIAAINARGMRVLVTDGELRAVLGAEGYSLGLDGEIDQARGAVELLSKRSVQTAANRERIEAEWRVQHPGREPSQRVKNGWDAAAWAEGRRAKPIERETPEQLCERVRVELAAAGFDFTPQAHEHTGWDRSVLSQPALVSVGQVDRDELATEAVAVLSANKSAWSNADLAAGVEAAVARSGVVGDPQAVEELVEDVAARAADRCLSVLDPEIHTPTSMSRHLTSEAVMNADMALNLGLAGLAGDSAAGDSGAPDSAGDSSSAAWDRAGESLARSEGLDAGQGAAVAALCGARRLEVVIGPAGTGKTAMLSVAKARLDAQGRDLVVLAPTRKAAQVAASEVGMEGASVSKLLYDHGWRWDELGRWSRLAPGTEDPATGRLYQGVGEESQLSASSVVVVDEAGLLTVDQANALIDVVAESGAALRLVGDPRQLGAVGRGGVMESAKRWVPGGAVTLDEVHRFLSVGADEQALPVTEPDVAYGELTLRLREGVEPDAVADELTARGAVMIHESETEAISAIAAEVAGAGALGVVAVTVATNADAQVLNQAVRDRRVAAGEVCDTQVALAMDETRIGVGDWITTRCNDTARDVANRETWVVEAVTTDGEVLARSKDRHVRLDAGYVAEAVQLGYVTTDYGNQGVTADCSLTWVTDATTAGGLYVAATRGRYENTVHVVAEDAEGAHQRLVAAMGRDRADRGLDVARSRAEADAEVVRHTDPLIGAGAGAGAGAGVDVGVDAAGGGASDKGFDVEVPTSNQLEALRHIAVERWRTEEELRTEAEQIEVVFFTQIEALGDDDAVLDRAEHARRDEADRVLAQSARRQAADARTTAVHLDAARAEVALAVGQDLFAARDAARTAADPPGLTRSRQIRHVEVARQVLGEIAERLGLDLSGLPAADASDSAMAASITAVAAAVVDRQVAEAAARAEAADTEAAAADARISARGAEQRRCVEANDVRRQARQTIVADTETARAVLSAREADRAHAAAIIGPQLTATLDMVRSASWWTPSDVFLASRQAAGAQAEGLRSVGENEAVLDRADHVRRDEADQLAALQAAAVTQQTREQLASVEARREALREQLTATYEAARADAQVIAGGRGLFGRHSAALDAASAARRQLAAEVGGLGVSKVQLPDALSTDAEVEALVTQVVDQVIDPQIAACKQAATEAHHQRLEAQRRIEQRADQQRRAHEANERRDQARTALQARYLAEEARITRAQARRVAAAEVLSVEQLADADRLCADHAPQRVEQDASEQGEHPPRPDRFGVWQAHRAGATPKELVAARRAGMSLWDLASALHNGCSFADALDAHKQRVADEEMMHSVAEEQHQRTLGLDRGLERGLER